MCFLGIIEILRDIERFFDISPKDVPENSLDKFTVNDDIITWMVWPSVVYCLLFVLLLYLLFWGINRRKVWRWAEKELPRLFAIAWVFGFVVYDIGMCTENRISLLRNAPMAIIHAFQMFLLESDVSAIHDAYHDSAWYMGLFSLAHFFAAAVTLIFVVKLFGFQITNGLKRAFAARCGKKDILYIFWGMNEPSYLLAKDIVKYHTDDEEGRKTSFRLIVVRTNRDDGQQSLSPNGLSRLFNFLSLGGSDFEHLQELCDNKYVYATSTYADITKVENPTQKHNLFDELRLKSVMRFMDRTSQGIHIFCLSGDENENLHTVSALKKGAAVADLHVYTKLYCHARYNSIHRVIEDELTKKNVEVKVIDSSHISVELMKMQPELHPVNYVKVERDVTVSSDFNALVVGLGEVGLDTVRFLYEFGAFVKSGDCKVRRSNFCCHVTDPKMKELAGLFAVSAPSVNITMNRQEEEFTKKMINLYDLDCQSIEFYRRLEKWIKDLNYVVLATGEDETNISMAVRIMRLAIQKRRESRESSLDRFRILVRIKHDENARFHTIAEHYNRLWAAEKAGVGSTDNLHQKEILSTYEAGSPITLFGSAETVYTYDNIVREALKEDAKRFKRRYDISVNNMRVAAGKEPYKIVSWEDEQADLMQLNIEYEGYAPTYSGIMKLRRVQSQNMANSLHKATKSLLAEKALGSQTMNDIKEHGLTREEGSTSYSWRDRADVPISHIQRVLDVLAQTEHLRWNASHELLGYEKHDSEGFKDEARLIHGCLREWDELTSDKQSYDYNTVDVSLGMIDIV